MCVFSGVRIHFFYHLLREIFPKIICIYTYICVCVYIYIYIFFFFYRERERTNSTYNKIHTYIYISYCVYIYIYIHMKPLGYFSELVIFMWKESTFSTVMESCFFILSQGNGQEHQGTQWENWPLRWPVTSALWPPQNHLTQATLCNSEKI